MLFGFTLSCLDVYSLIFFRIIALSSTFLLKTNYFGISGLLSIFGCIGARIGLLQFLSPGGIYNLSNDNYWWLPDWSFDTLGFTDPRLTLDCIKFEESHSFKTILNGFLPDWFPSNKDKLSNALIFYEDLGE